MISQFQQTINSLSVHKNRLPTSTWFIAVIGSSSIIVAVGVASKIL